MDRRRITILAILLLLPLAGLEARLVQLQLVESGPAGGRLRESSESLQPVSSCRGRILDHFGRELARSELAFALDVRLSEFEASPAVPRPEVLERLLKRVDCTRENFQNTIDDLYRRIYQWNMKSRPQDEQLAILKREREKPYPLLDWIPLETAFEIETNPELYPGLVVREKLKRVYPYGEVAGPVIGTVGPILADEGRILDRCAEKKHQPSPCPECREEATRFRRESTHSFLTPEFIAMAGEETVEDLVRTGAFLSEMTGRTGLERYHDEALRGRTGVLSLERNRRTKEEHATELQPSVQGGDVVLTLDIELCRDVAAILGEARSESGPARATAVVLDPRDGAVRALVSNVTFDPNIFTPPASKERVRAVLSDTLNKPMLVHAVNQHYPLGSIFKVVTAVAALEERKTVPSRIITCTGHFLPNVLNSFRCNSIHGEVDLHAALQRSCNIYFYEMGQELGLETLSTWSSRFGIGQRTEIDLPRETPGSLPTPQNVKNWQKTSICSVAIGQGDLMVTPIQAARVLAVFANGGRLVTPHLAVCERREPTALPISAATLREVREGLRAVVQEPHGTAHSSGLAEFDAAGKTSSAQTDPTRGKAAHAWFGGFFPYENPTAVVVVLVEFGGSGGHAAAPLATRIAAKVKERLGASP